MASFLSAWKQLDDGRDRAEFYRMWLSGASAGFTVPRIMDLMARAPHHKSSAFGAGCSTDPRAAMT